MSCAAAGCEKKKQSGDNRTCRSPASGSPTGFTVRHTTGQSGAGVRDAADRVLHRRLRKRIGEYRVSPRAKSSFFSALFGSAFADNLFFSTITAQHRAARVGRNGLRGVEQPYSNSCALRACPWQTEQDRFLRLGELIGRSFARGRVTSPRSNSGRSRNVGW